MTNGELIQKFFDCEVCEPIPEVQGRREHKK